MEVVVLAGDSSLSELSTSSDEEAVKRHTQLARQGTEWLNSIHASVSSAPSASEDYDKVAGDWQAALVYSFLTKISQFKQVDSAALTFESFVNAFTSTDSPNALLLAIIKHLQKLLLTTKTDPAKDWSRSLANYVSDTIDDPHAYFPWKSNKLLSSQSDHDSAAFWQLSPHDKLVILRSLVDSALSDSDAIRHTVDEHYNVGRQRVVKRSPLENPLVVDPLGQIGNVQVYAIDDSYHLFAMTVPPPQASSSAYIAKTRWSLLARDRESYERVVRSLDKQVAELESKLESLRVKHENDVADLKASGEYASLSNPFKKAKEAAIEKDFKAAEKALVASLSKLKPATSSKKSSTKKPSAGEGKTTKVGAAKARKEERMEAERALKSVLSARMADPIPAYFTKLERAAERRRKAQEMEAFRQARAARLRSALGGAASDSDEGMMGGRRPTRGARLKAEHALSSWGAKQNAYDRLVENVAVASSSASVASSVDVDGAASAGRSNGHRRRSGEANGGSALARGTRSRPAGRKGDKDGASDYSYQDQDQEGASTDAELTRDEDDSDDGASNAASSRSKPRKRPSASTTREERARRRRGGGAGAQVEVDIEMNGDLNDDDSGSQDELDSLPRPSTSSSPATASSSKGTGQQKVWVDGGRAGGDKASVSDSEMSDG